MQKKGANISLKGYDDIFSTDQSRAEAQQERVQEIPLSELHPFEGHPFRVVDDEEMMKTAESVRDFGVLTPAIVRPDPDGGYEIVSGHRRHRASELAGKETMPAIVRDLDDDAAIILMVDANLQRETILPSERAFAYKMKLDAIKHQGERTDLTSAQLGQKSWAVNQVAEQSGDSRVQVQRYIRLTELIKEMARKQGVTEELKAEDMMKWVGLMNNIRACADEIVLNDMPDLYAFDGDNKPDLVNRIEVNYHRVTKIKPKVPISEHAEYAVWDYTESLIVDRESESIEHIQNIGSGCSVSRKYKVEGGVESLLEDMDAENIYDHIEGNPENVVLDPLETIDYTIKVISQKGNEKLIQGTYDKKGLPDDWAEFMESVFEFMSFYGWGEIMNPSVYGKVWRCDDDIIYCSVEFEDGYKSYYYISDDDTIEVGDFVLVPAGKNNHEAVVEVVKKEYFAEEDVPLPMEKTKHIIRKCTEDDFLFLCKKLRITWVKF